MEIDAPEIVQASAIFLSGLVFGWLLSVVTLTVEDRLATSPREQRPWRLAHRQALFWFVVVVTLAIAVRSIEATDDVAVSIRRAASVLGALLGAWALIHSSNEFLSWYVRGRLRVRPFLSNTALPIVQRFTAIAITLTAFFFVLDVFDQSVAPLLAIVSLLGFGIALAVRDPLANFFAGTTLATDGGLKVGDSVEIESERGRWGVVMGTVVGIGWRSTRIMTRNGNVITVPNSKLAESFLTNYSVPTRDMGVNVRAGVVLGSDLTLVEEATLEVAGEIQSAHMVSGQTFTPIFVYDGFANNAVEFTVSLRARSYDDSFRLVSDFIKALDARFREEGIEMAIPATRVDLRRIESVEDGA